MKKEAIGIAINGREVKIAHIFHDKYHVGVDFLESAVFTTDIDAELKKREEQSPEPTALNEEEDLFTTKSPYSSKSPLEKETGVRENVDILYSLLSKFAARKIKVAFNISPSRVTYQDLDTDLDYNKNVFKGNLKKKIESWKKGFNELDKVSVITRKDGTLCNVISETYQPPILDILESLNTFFKGNLFLALMDSNDVSLVNLARVSYDFRGSSEITVIVEIETEFSRIIFMRGDDLLTVSPIINESFNPDIINIVYSKIIYELDNSNIPEISNILLAGRASSFTAKSFFEKKFPEAKVGFVVSQPLAENLSTQFSREDLSNYAIPIALAWKAMDSNKENFIPTNLLSSQIIDRQKVLTLSLAGYVLLVLLGITAFIVTWKITAKKIEVRDLRNQNFALQEQIDKSESTVNRVHEIENEINEIKKQIILSDSLSFGSDKLLTFLEKLNQSVSNIRTIWVEEIQNTVDGFLIKGISMKRGDVPRISEELGGSKIKKLTRTESRRAYTFEMEVNWTQPRSQPKFKIPMDSEQLPPLKTASAEPKSENTITSEWGTETVVTQTIVAEQDAGKQTENNTIIPDTQSPSVSSVQSQSSQTYAENKKTDQFSDSETIPKELRLNNELESGMKMKLENNPAPAITYQEKAKSENDSATRTTGSKFTIKISAHASNFTAKKEVEFYRARGFDAYITTLPNSSRDIPYWVCLGDFASYQEAEQELNRLNQAVPGKRVVIEVSKNRIINHPSPLSAQSTTDTDQSPKSNNRMIKQANHTEVSYPDKITDNQQNFSNSNSQYFTIRVSAHVTKFTAKKEVEFYRSKGFDTYVANLPNSSREIPYSVCLGQFSSFEQAQQKIKELMGSIPRSYSVIAINK